MSENQVGSAPVSFSICAFESAGTRLLILLPYTCLSIVERARNADLDGEGVATGENDFMDERLKYKLWSMDAGGDNEHFTDEHVEDKSWSTIDDRRR